MIGHGADDEEKYEREIMLYGYTVKIYSNCDGETRNV